MMRNTSGEYARQGAGCALRAALSFPDSALGGAIVLSGFLGAPEVSWQIVPTPSVYRILVSLTDMS